MNQYLVRYDLFSKICNSVAFYGYQIIKNWGRFWILTKFEKKTLTYNFFVLKSTPIFSWWFYYLILSEFRICPFFSSNGNTIIEVSRRRSNHFTTRWSPLLSFCLCMSKFLKSKYIKKGGEGRVSASFLSFYMQT